MRLCKDRMAACCRLRPKVSPEWGQISIEVMAVYNLPVGRFVDAVHIVPHPDAVVDARAHQLGACLRAEVC